MKLEHSVMQNVMQKTNSKWIKGLNVRPDTIKLLQENIGRTLDMNQSKILYDPPPRVMEIKTKINKWDLIKLKNLHSKGKQPTEWEKIFPNDATNKGLISKIY